MRKHFKSFSLIKYQDKDNQIEFAPPEPSKDTISTSITPIPRICRYKSHDPEDVDSVFFIIADEDIDAA